VVVAIAGHTQPIHIQKQRAFKQIKRYIYIFLPGGQSLIGRH